MTIYTTRLNKIYDDQLTQHPLEEVIGEIRSDQHKALVDQIRSSEDASAKEHKFKLPAFFPTIQIFDKNKLNDTSIPTGIIQFDLDLKDDPDTDFEILKQKIIDIPQVFYAFTSPGGGLKFGILSDFRKKEDESLDSLKCRYKQAYQNAQEHLSSYITVAYDDCMTSIKHPCYLSHDPDAYYNPDCNILEVNHLCEYKPPAYLPRTISADANQVTELLEHIPKNLKYDERFPINCAVIAELGKGTGIPILQNHWDKTKDKLQKQFKSISESNCYGNLGHLVNVAKKHGWIPNKQYPKQSDHIFPELLSPEDASIKIRKIIQEFIHSGTSTLLNISTGAGKTQEYLMVLSSLDPNAKVLVLVKDHKLAMELTQRFSEIQKQIRSQIKNNPSTPLKEKLKRCPNMVHIRGKLSEIPDQRPVCDRYDDLLIYKESSIAPPIEECRNKCLSYEEYSCPYIDQFDGLSLPSNIRVMTHEELYNQQSYFFNGMRIHQDSDGGAVYWKTRAGNWTPEFIIVDEDCIRVETEVADANSYHLSIMKIIHDCRQGTPLTQAIQNHAKQIILDSQKMENQQSTQIKFTSAYDYINKLKKKGKPCKVLTALHNHVVSGAGNDNIDHIRFDEKHNSIILNKFLDIDPRHNPIPKLFLDATAVPSIPKKVFGENLNVQEIHVEGSPDINVYQCSNRNITKNYLNDPVKFDVAARNIEMMLEKKNYNKVGLITYKKHKDNLATRLRIPQELSGHFGALRGINAFEDVDCLLIVGRYLLPPETSLNHTCGIFGDTPDKTQVLVDSPVRMPENRSQSLRKRIYQDRNLSDVEAHFSTGETIQALGRARLIYGSPKDVYLFSNESLGGAVEISDFFEYQDLNFRKQINAMMQQGFCHDVPRELLKSGLTEHHIKNNRDQFREECRILGLPRCKITFKNPHYEIKTHDYFLSDRDALRSHFEAQQSVLLTVNPD